MRNETYDLRAANLLRHMERLKINQAQLAEILDRSRAYVSQTASGKRFGEKAARFIEDRLRLPTGCLDRKEDSDLDTIEVWSSPSELQEDAFALVPRVALSPSGQEVTQHEESVLPPLAFRASWLMKMGVTAREKLRTCDVTDDRMAPFIDEGDVVLIDTGQTDVVDNMTYAIRYGDRLRVQRVSRRFDGGILLRSDNAKYPDEVLSKSEAKHITVLGRMIWRGGGVA